MLCMSDCSRGRWGREAESSESFGGDPRAQSNIRSVPEASGGAEGEFLPIPYLYVSARPLCTKLARASEASRTLTTPTPIAYGS